MEREIGNVAADVGLRAFRYLSFAPVAFDVRPVAARDEAPDAVPHVEDAVPAADDAAALPEHRGAAQTVGMAAHAGMPAPAPRASEPAGRVFEAPAASGAGLPQAPAWPPVREAFTEGMPSFGFTAVAAPGGAAAPDLAAPAPGLFAPTPEAPSFTSLAQAMPAPAFVMAAPPAEVVAVASHPFGGAPVAGGFAPVPPAEAAPRPIMPNAFAGPAGASMGLTPGPRQVPPPGHNPFAAQPVPPAESAPPRLRRLAELQGEVPPARAAHPAAAPRRYALLQDVRSELAGRAPPAPPRRDPPA